MAKFIKCDCCGNRIQFGEEVYKFSGYAGLFCSGDCFAHSYGEVQELDDELDKMLKDRGVEKIYNEDDFFAPMASGSFYFDCAVVVPCSMKTLGKIANSIADNLIVRAAEVALKERRKLIVVPRESPLATTQIRNMLTLSQAGAIILPASPAFYHKPKTIDNLIDFVVARILSAIGLNQELVKEWGYEKEL